MSSVISNFFPSRFIPKWLLTWVPSTFSRIRVDVAQTSFFTGYQFRTVKRLSIAAGTTYTIKWSRLTNVVLLGLSLESSAGTIRMNVYRGGTPSAALSDTLPVIKKNDMTTVLQPPPASQSSITGGVATVSGGEFRDALDVIASTATAQQSTVGGSVSDERGFSAETDGYYTFTNDGSGTATGIIHFFWEERP